MTSPEPPAAPLGTFEPLPHPQGEAVFGPLHNPGIIEHHAGEDDPLASHHCLVLWFLHEPRLCHCGQRKGISQGSGCPACRWPCRQRPVLRHGAATELPPARPHREPPQGSPWSLEVLEGLLGVLDPPKPGSAVPLSPSPVQRLGLISVPQHSACHTASGYRPGRGGEGRVACASAGMPDTCMCCWPQGRGWGPGPWESSGERGIEVEELPLLQWFPPLRAFFLKYSNDFRRGAGEGEAEIPFGDE